MSLGHHRTRSWDQVSSIRTKIPTSSVGDTNQIDIVIDAKSHRGKSHFIKSFSDVLLTKKTKNRLDNNYTISSKVHSIGVLKSIKEDTDSFLGGGSFGSVHTVDLSPYKIRQYTNLFPKAKQNILKGTIVPVEKIFKGVNRKGTPRGERDCHKESYMLDKVNKGGCIHVPLLLTSSCEKVDRSGVNFDEYFLLQSKVENAVTAKRFFGNRGDDINVFFKNMLITIMDVSSVMGCATGQGVSHRDLKFDNIMIQMSPDNNISAWVIDWGIACYVGYETKHKPIHLCTSMAGTIIYNSPELLDNKWPTVPKNITDVMLVDVWAFAMNIYELLTHGMNINGYRTTGTIIDQIIRNGNIAYKRNMEDYKNAVKSIDQDSLDIYINDMGKFLGGMKPEYIYELKNILINTLRINPEHRMGWEWINTHSNELYERFFS